MNVSANFFIGSGAYTPVWVSDIFVSFLLAFKLGFRTLVRDYSDLLFSEGGLRVFNGEFDPGSGRTLAACLTHASRAVRPFGVHERRTGE